MTQRSSQDPAVWLLGVWRTNKEKTLANYSWPSTEAKESFARDLGKLVSRYTATELHQSWDDKAVNEVRYRIAWKSDSELFLVVGNGDQESGTHLKFLSPTEFFTPMGKGGFEYFAKESN